MSDDNQKFESVSLRDWFAGQALMGLMARDTKFNPDQLALVSYEQADAMLDKRKFHE
jgi:hypothetical protein